MTKIGKGAKDIFSSTATKPVATPAKADKGPGRPPIHKDTWTKVTVVLFDRQIVSLDRMATDIRAKTGAVISRAEIIRGLVDAFIEAGIDLTDATSEADLKEAVGKKLA